MAYLGDVEERRPERFRPTKCADTRTGAYRDWWQWAEDQDGSSWWRTSHVEFEEVHANYSASVAHSDTVDFPQAERPAHGWRTSWHWHWHRCALYRFARPWHLVLPLPQEGQEG